MSTRATVHFCWDGETKPEAIVYRHCDGYPEGLGADLEEFFDAVKEQTKDTRFDDPSYLAAKFVVWQANEYATQGKEYGKSGKMLDFLSVGVLLEDPGDIDYRYIVHCKGERPTVECKYLR